MAHQFSTSYIEDSLSLFRYYKKLGEGAIEQVSDEQLFASLDREMNSIAIIVKHIAGNMRSRWTDFLTSDGEKADRNRDTNLNIPPPRVARCSNSGARAGIASSLPWSRCLILIANAPSASAANRIR